MNKSKEKQLRHLSQSLQLEEAVNPAIIRTTMTTVSLAIIAFTIWAGFTNINEVARTPGEVVPDGYEQVVQHLEGGIVDQINVREGDIVEKGQTVIILRGAGTDEDLERAVSKQTSLSMQEERLRAYIEKRQPDFSPFEQSHADIVRDQKNFFQNMQSANNEEQLVIKRQIEQKRQSITSLSVELETERRNLQISSNLFEKKQQLHAKGFLSETKFLEAQQSMNKIQGSVTRIQSQMATARAEIDEYQNRLTSLSLGQNDRINERLDAIIAEKEQNGEIIRKLEEKSKRLAIQAPVTGVVNGLTLNTIGSVVRPGETIMNIVPVNEELVVEVKIPPQHIGHVHVGQDVKVKLSSYDFSRYGLVNGKLEKISATTFNGQNGERYYQGKIKVERNYVGNDRHHPIMPGMTVMAEIITGEKTILQYLLKPIHNSLKTAFSER
ncbi:MAG: HlyD family type I secretion periplasmic adaptor subunit [Micavibrio aeruginosavorus]|uniref:HlyD family type I secretion periplasmic adaptor subunit n=1 Tax=Micavibrio aeruginosavorus TaxID=349221 RepID=A0A2W4ZYA2_9BACT|nr:MAG: HlyD family type I secretion periplasmic adaptor subunit [Micavibrio aeruginosavorus]